MFRIQKILLANFQEIYEPVLVENPFAEVTEDGIGIRQVQLGLTPTKILVGADVFENGSTCCSCSLTYLSIVEKDPEIECFELVSVLPLEILNVTFFKKNMRMIMNVRISEAKNMFFEFGGHLSQNLFWNTWRERIATLKQIGPNLFNLTGSSPFSSTDVIPDEEEVTASIHSKRWSNSLSAQKSATNLPLKDVTSYYKQLSSKYTDIIEKTSSISLSDSEYRHQMEVQNYYQSLSIKNSFSCGCNTSWSKLSYKEALKQQTQDEVLFRSMQP
ncbi:uncharacterized protein LOC129908500 [Episyrphus balteatus]|uniref:uncharacterized protein LOC129908500 n=1 Tax=Episyrphus balteatus TaxID=286459 RepID=UPI002485E132|nr:uncharacterized protein LOC129908500 [Episyrphus balteatus]